MSSKILSVVMLLPPLLLAACATPSGEVEEVRILTQADSGSSLVLKPGERLEIHLPGNPTTGYTWEYAAGDPAVLAALGEVEYTQSTTPAGTPVLGAGGEFILRYTAAAPGATTLHLVYHQSFNPDIAPEAEFILEVVVE